jgi:multicomponent Na+:H+ antiporter subunit A
MVLAAVLSGFLLSVFAPWINKMARSAAGWILAILPIGLFIYFTGFLSPISSNQHFIESTPWASAISINLSFNVDGLSLLFALIITGIGALVIIYAGGYLAHDEFLGRFYVHILMFMASMLGVVLSNNVLTLFIFWELTSITSYMLIGYYHEEADSRAAALQALLVTGTGGLALLAGLVLMALVGGSWEISELLTKGEAITTSALYLPILILVLLGAFTKSAQFPFHFWLPNAMAAPAPVSTYLHSATMVKAGIYLMARMSPALGGTTAWAAIVTTFGAVTMLLAAHMAWQHTDIKRILAYSTVSALGILTMLLGLGHHYAVEAAMVFLVVHSMYKGGLFMVGGAVDHETGTRFIDKLGGLRKTMPVTAGIAVLAALSMAGIPPAFGFVGKELIYEGTTSAGAWSFLVTLLAFLTNGLTITAAIMVVWPVFFGPPIETPKHPHEAPLSMLIGPGVLGVTGMLFGLFAGTVGVLFIGPAVSAILHHDTEVELALWHGFSPILLLSLVTIALGVGVYYYLPRLKQMAAPANGLARFGPEKWYEWSLDGMLSFGRWQTRMLQSGYLRNYLIIMVVTLVALTGYTLYRYGVFTSNVMFRPPKLTGFELILLIMIVSATAMVIQSKSRLAAVAALGVVGFGVALVFVLFGAPDLAMTQFSIETLSVILLVLVLYKLPRFVPVSGGHTAKAFDIISAVLGGGLMTMLVLLVTALPAQSRLAPYFAENSYLLAHGHNVVNVILVDFRGFDTMGEITVLGIAAIGVFGLLKLRLEKDNNPVADPKQLEKTRHPSDIYPVVRK